VGVVSRVGIKWHLPHFFSLAERDTAFGWRQYGRAGKKLCTGLFVKA